MANRSVFCYFGFLSLFSLGSFAQPITQFTHQILDTSDRISFNQSVVLFDNERMDLSFPYKNEVDSGLSYGAEVVKTDGSVGESVDFVGLGFSANLKLKKKSKVFNLTLGHSTLDSTKEQIQEESTFLLYGIRSQSWHFLEKLYLDASFGQAPYYLNLALPGAVEDHLNSQYFRFNFVWKAKKRIRVIGRNERANVSDLNKRQSHDLSVLYGVSPGWPWIWIGVGVNSLSFDNNEEGYWSPGSFLGYGLRSEASFPVWQQLSGSLALNYSKQQEKGFEWGSGSAAAVGLSWGDRNSSLIGLKWFGIQSFQGANEWSQNSLTFSLQSSW